MPYDHSIYPWRMPSLVENRASTASAPYIGLDVQAGDYRKDMWPGAVSVGAGCLVGSSGAALAEACVDGCIIPPEAVGPIANTHPEAHMRVFGRDTWEEYAANARRAYCARVHQQSHRLEQLGLDSMEVIGVVSNLQGMEVDMELRPEGVDFVAAPVPSGRFALGAITDDVCDMSIGHGASKSTVLNTVAHRVAMRCKLCLMDCHKDVCESSLRDTYSCDIVMAFLLANAELVVHIFCQEVSMCFERCEVSGIASALVRGVTGIDPSKVARNASTAIASVSAGAVWAVLDARAAMAEEMALAPVHLGGAAASPSIAKVCADYLAHYNVVDGRWQPGDSCERALRTCVVAMVSELEDTADELRAFAGVVESMVANESIPVDAGEAGGRSQWLVRLYRSLPRSDRRAVDWVSLARRVLGDPSSSVASLYAEGCCAIAERVGKDAVASMDVALVGLLLRKTSALECCTASARAAIAESIVGAEASIAFPTFLDSCCYAAPDQRAQKRHCCRGSGFILWELGRDAPSPPAFPLQSGVFCGCDQVQFLGGVSAASMWETVRVGCTDAHAHSVRRATRRYDTPKYAKWVRTVVESTTAAIDKARSQPLGDRVGTHVCPTPPRKPSSVPPPRPGCLGQPRGRACCDTLMWGTPLGLALVTSVTGRSCDLFFLYYDALDVYSSVALAVESLDAGQSVVVVVVCKSSVEATGATQLVRDVLSNVSDMSSTSVGMAWVSVQAIVIPWAFEPDASL